MLLSPTIHSDLARLALVAAMLLSAASTSSGCAHGGLEGDVYRGDGFAFRFALPKAGWRQLEASHAAVAYRHEGARATMMINARCGLDSDDVPLLALTNHLFMQFTERDVSLQRVVPFAGREAMHSVVDAKLDGVSLRYEVWVLKKDGCVYDLVYLAPPNRFEDQRSAYQAMVEAFATLD